MVGWIITLWCACMAGDSSEMRHDRSSDGMTAVADTITPRLDDENFENELESMIESDEDMENSSLLELLEDVPSSQVSFRPRPSVQTRNRAMRKLQDARGFRDGRYLGSPWRSYHRLRVTQGEHFSGALLMEKDPGEPKLHDFAAGHLFVRNIGPLAKLTMGDYNIEAGQGIVLWRGYGFRKGANVVAPVVRRAQGVVPYASADEHAFLRGIAAELRHRSVTVMGFYSQREMSGTMGSHGEVTSLYTTGYFRTETERSKKGNFRETLIGARGHYAVGSGIHLGATGYQSRMSTVLSLKNPIFVGDRVTVIGVDYTIPYRTLLVTGEWARSNNSTGGVTGFHVRPDRRTHIVLAYRDYAAQFFNMHNFGFGERIGTSNESGWYTGLSVAPHRRVRLSAYYDQFTFKQPTASVYFPGNGHEFFVQSDITPARFLTLTPRYRRKETVERKSVVNETGTTIRLDDRKERVSYRLTGEYRPNRNATWRTRVEYLQIAFRYTARKEHGILASQDLVLRSANVTMNARLVFFRSDSYESGIAEFERDLPGVFTIPRLYGHGMKWYIVVSYKFVPPFLLSVKYSELMREDVKNIGSGLEQLPGNRDNRIGLQLDASW